MIETRPTRPSRNGYPTAALDDARLLRSPETTTDEYADSQAETNPEKTLRFIVPILSRTDSRVVLDVGCGVGASVLTLLEHGYDAYGVDGSGLAGFWKRQGCPRERFFIVDLDDFELPFADESVCLAYSIGVIEHVGTVNGHATRAADYEQRRRRWIREVYRTVRRGGYLLMGGPNRCFPIDVAHGLDSCASLPERTLSRLVGASVHKTWGESFLWGYSDLRAHLEGLSYEMEPLAVTGLLQYSRVPSVLRPLVRYYVEKLPRPLLGTGFNPWVLALIRKV
jgi:SAM-dependent methyltransferase